MRKKRSIKSPSEPLLPTDWVDPSPAPQTQVSELKLPDNWDKQPCLLNHRPYQTVVFKKWKEKNAGLLALLWRRQGGKTTTLAELAVRQMFNPGRLVTFASVSLLCGRELVYKEAQVFLRAFAALRQKAAKKNCRLEIFDSITGEKVFEPKSNRPQRHRDTESEKRNASSPCLCASVVDKNSSILLEGVPLDDFAALYESQRLEFRLDHGKKKGISRTLIIAPNPATARGWTGDVMIDEIGFIKDLQELWEAMEPIVSSDKSLRVIMSTTPPDDDAHYAFELLAPGKVGCAVPSAPGDGPIAGDGPVTPSPCHLVTLSPCQENVAGTRSPSLPSDFPPNPAGHWYRSAAGILVHRCDIYDAAAGGAPVLDLETREMLTPQEHFARALDKDAWRRNYGLQFLPGGASAVPLDQLAHAQAAGQGEALFLQIETAADLETALNFLGEHITGGPVGVGWDLATSEKLTANPSALAVIEDTGARFVARLVLAWKTADAEEAESRVRAVLDCIGARTPTSATDAGPARRLCIDATNEALFANEMKRAFLGQVLVEPIIASQTVKLPGQKEPVTYKVLLGHELLNALNDGRLALPPGRYIKEDFRLVKRNRGTFETELSPQGLHGDTFDACKLALRAVTAKPPGAVAMVA